MDQQQRLDAVRCLSARASCRSFSAEDVSQETLDTILEAILHSASGGNLQPWSVIVERDKERNQRLAEINGGQAFMHKAPVNLIFLMDWYRYSIYAKEKNAPFQAHNSGFHFLIAMEDVMCAAQTAETTVHLLGLGSCYVGTCISCSRELAEMYHLPQHTFPVVILSIGHPARELPPMPKLRREMMIFEGSYPQLSKEEIIRAYEEKYQGRTMSLPSAEPFRAETLEHFADALSTTYDPEKVAAIIAQAETDGFINETQRRFGLHYHAGSMTRGNPLLLDDMAQRGICFVDVPQK